MSVKQNKFNILRFFIDKYRLHTVLIFLVRLGTGILEGLGVAALLPLVSTIINQDQQSDSPLYNVVSKIFSFLNIELTLENSLCVIIVLFFLKAALSYFAALYTSKISSKMIFDFRETLIGALLKSKWSFYIQNATGHFTNALLSEAQRSGGCFKSLSDIVAAFLQILILMGVAFLASWKLVALSALTSVLMWILLYRFIRITGTTGLQLRDASKRISADITDILQNIKPLKAMHMEVLAFSKIKQDSKSLFHISTKQMMAKQSMGIFHEPLLILIMSMGLYVSITYIHMETTVLMVLAAIFYRFIIAWRQLQQAVQVLSGQESYFWSLQDCIESAQKEEEGYKKGEAFKPLQSIQFDKVSFSYDQKLVLSDLDITIEANKLIGLCGPSGTGKTTIIDLLCRLYTPSSGQILVDGSPLEDFDLYAWRLSIGYVPQEFITFNESILYNITMGDKNISEDDVIAALKKSEAWDFVSALPEGIHSNIGERGGKISGGQRQRISIARALVRNPAILIMDEATASLDAATESEIFDTLQSLSKSMTIIVVSHQQMIHDKADYVIDLGKTQKA